MAGEQAGVRLAELKAQGDQLMAQGRQAEARAAYRQACTVSRTDIEACVKLSTVERLLGDFGAAEKEARRAVRRAPKFFLAHNALGLALHAQGQAGPAIRCYEASAALQPTFPDTRYLLGVALHERGRLGEAVAAFRKAMSLRANYFDAIAGLAAVLVVQGEHEEAERLLDAALKLNPNSAEALANLATLREQAGEVEEALGLYRQAVSLAPARLDILTQLAALLERQNRWGEAKALLAPVAMDGDPAAALVLGRIARREGRLEDGVAVLEAAGGDPANPLLAGQAQILAGQLLDQLGQPERAFAHFVSGNRKVAAALQIDLSAPPPYLGDVAQARGFLSDEVRARGQADMAGRGASPVFLIGFPRSGTTLLEQVLDSHPQVQSMDEKPAAGLMRGRFLDMVQAEGVDLATLSPAQAAELRDLYFQRVDEFVPRRPGAVFIDKLPLNIVWAHLIWRVFPQARFILALRHPLDVCLSCFMQDFAINTAMSSFLSLESTAATYAAVMGLWREQAAALPLAYHPVRYEDLVADLPGQAAATLQFLGLPWDEQVLDHRAAVGRKALINTPSYHQVARPIYQEAAFRWKRYQREVGGISETLAPFIEAFGYSSPS